MEDELILADLGVVERRLERLEKDLKKSRSPPSSNASATCWSRCKAALEDGHAAARARPRRRRPEAAARLPVPLGQAAAARAQPRRGRRRRRRRHRGRRGQGRASTDVLSRAATRAVPICAKIELEIAQLEPADAAAFMADLGLQRIGPRSRDPRELRPARLHLVLHRRRGRVPRLVDPARHDRAGWPPAKSTATSRAASSAPRSSPTSRWSRAARMAACREHGELRLEGKEYVVADGDVINFRLAT